MIQCPWPQTYFGMMKSQKLKGMFYLIPHSEEYHLTSPRLLKFLTHVDLQLRKRVFLCQSNNETHVYGFLFKVINKTFYVVSSYFEFKILRDFQII